MAGSGVIVGGAVVYEVGALRQAVTDAEGRFSLQVDGRAVQLRVQALGYHEITVGVEPGVEEVEVRLQPAWPPAFLEAMVGQQDDPDFRPRVSAPAFPPGEGPIVAIDEGHHNFHTARVRYRTFAEILALDGHRVRPSGAAFTAEALADVDVLVVATPIDGLDTGLRHGRSPIRPEEAANLREWVEDGGALLIIGDHQPVPGALAPLLEAFQVRFEDGYALQCENGRPSSHPVVFRTSDGSLCEHAVLQGRGPYERVDSVATFTGFAFRVGPPFEPLMVLPAGVLSMTVESWLAPNLDGPTVPVGGWLQGALARIGRGRVAIMGEAAMFTAQVRGPDRRANGLTSPEGGENGQFLVNLVHWLGGSLDP